MGGDCSDHIYIALGTHQEFCRNSTILAGQISLAPPLHRVQVTLLPGSRLGPHTGSGLDTEALDSCMFSLFSLRKENGNSLC